MRDGAATRCRRRRRFHCHAAIAILRLCRCQPLILCLPLLLLYFSLPSRYLRHFLPLMLLLPCRRFQDAIRADAAAFAAALRHCRHAMPPLSSYCYAFIRYAALRILLRHILLFPCHCHIFAFFSFSSSIFIFLLRHFSYYDTILLLLLLLPRFICFHFHCCYFDFRFMLPFHFRFLSYADAFFFFTISLPYYMFDFAAAMLLLAAPPSHFTPPPIRHFLRLPFY